MSFKPVYPNEPDTTKGFEPAVGWERFTAEEISNDLVCAFESITGEPHPSRKEKGRIVNGVFQPLVRYTYNQQTEEK